MSAKFGLLDKVRVTDGLHKGLEDFVICDRETVDWPTCEQDMVATIGGLDGFPYRMTRAMAPS